MPCRLLALLRHAGMVWQCPLFGLERKSPADGQNDVKAGAQQALGAREVLGPDWEEKAKKGVSFRFRRDTPKRLKISRDR
jgi:hypothetical protein